MITLKDSHIPAIPVDAPEAGKPTWTGLPPRWARWVILDPGTGGQILQAPVPEQTREQVELQLSGREPGNCAIEPLMQAGKYELRINLGRLANASTPVDDRVYLFGLEVNLPSRTLRILGNDPHGQIVDLPRESRFVTINDCYSLDDGVGSLLREICWKLDQPVRFSLPHIRSLLAVLSWEGSSPGHPIFQELIEACITGESQGKTWRLITNQLGMTPEEIAHNGPQLVQWSHGTLQYDHSLTPSTTAILRKLLRDPEGETIHQWYEPDSGSSMHNNHISLIINNRQDDLMFTRFHNPKGFCFGHMWSRQDIAAVLCRAGEPLESMASYMTGGVSQVSEKVAPENSSVSLAARLLNQLADQSNSQIMGQPTGQPTG